MLPPPPFQCSFQAPVERKVLPRHQFVQLLAVLLIFRGDGVLCLLLHGLNKVLHVLESIDLQQQTRHSYYVINTKPR